MTDATKLSPEEHYALLYPNQAIPAWALDKMELFTEYEFTVLPGKDEETVPLAQVVGTSHDRYGNQLRWLDMLTSAQKSYNFALSNWPGFLNADTDDIEMVRVAGTDSLYIKCEGNHRVTALKLAGRASLSCKVSVAYPKLANEKSTVRRVDDSA